MQTQGIIECLMCMACIGAIQKDEGADSDDACAISYLTDESKQDIQDFQPFPVFLTGRRTLQACWWSSPL